MEIRCQALLFDLDGVLVDSRSVVERTWRHWALRHQMNVEQVLSFAQGRRTIDTLRAFAPHGDVESEAAWLEGAEVADVDGLVAIPAAQTLLVGLPAGSWAVVTSGGRRLARRRLEAVDLPVPPVLVTAEDVAQGKPAPDGYRLAAQQLGRDPASCLAFEDTPPGIAAARAAGARVIALATTHPAQQLGEAELVIPDFRGVTVRATPAGLAVSCGAA